jgi:hypothetical protein
MTAGYPRELSSKSRRLFSGSSMGRISIRSWVAILPSASSRAVQSRQRAVISLDSNPVGSP